MHTAKTHFEQVPLEVVKRIVEQQGGEQTGDKTETAGQGLAGGLQYPSWQKPCQEALMEVDLDKLQERVAAAEAAVFLRFQELGNSAGEQTERQALQDATHSLRYLKKDVLKFPDWETNAKNQSV